MTAYLAASLPAAFALVVALYFEGRSFGRSVARPMLRGFAFSIPVYIVLFLTRYAIELKFFPGRIYIYYSFRDYLFLAAAAVVCYALLTRMPKATSIGASLIDGISFYFGFFLFAGVLAAVVYGRTHTAYTLFLLPTARIAIVIYAGILSATARTLTGVVPYLLLVSILVFAALAGFVPLLFVLNYQLYAYLATSALISGSTFALIFVRKN